MTNTIPWIEKYRPNNINDIVYHDDIRNTLKKLINNKKFPHTIFFGPLELEKLALFYTCKRYMVMVIKQWFWN